MTGVTCDLLSPLANGQCVTGAFKWREAFLTIRLIHSCMEYEDAEYPYSKEKLPELPALLDAVEWDVLCVFDACRWDAFDEFCDGSEPVKSPVAHTFDWVDQICCADERDWSDVTYLSGTVMTSEVETVDDYDCSLDAHVKDHRQEFDPGSEAYSDLNGTTDPREITKKASVIEPPVVVHYFQPHNPFVGNLHLNVGTSFDETELGIDSLTGGSYEAELVRNGHVSLEMYRAAYIENVKLVWQETKPLRDSFDKVITTADHGEFLGPDRFGHGINTNQGHVVPFHTNWDVELPDPESVGAAPDHEWVTQGTENTENESDDSTETDQDLEEKLRALGYSY